MKIAVVGSRDFRNLDMVATFVRNLPAGTTVVSGGARGVDRTAETVGRARGLPEPEVFPVGGQYPTKREFARAAFRRNAAVADACDRMVAFWDGRSNGTRNAVLLALGMMKPVMLVFEDGGFLTNPQKIREVIE